MNRMDALICYCQYAEFLIRLRTAGAILRQKPDATIGVMSPLAVPNVVTKDTAIADAMAECMFELERLRGELGLEPLSASQMKTPESYDEAIWEGAVRAAERGRSHAFAGRTH